MKIELDTPDGRIGGWLARPQRPSTMGLIVIQEIFGVTTHIRDITDRYAREGFIALAPALFDVLEPDIDLPYNSEGMQQGRTLIGELGFDRASHLVDAAAQRLRETGATKVGVVGFCWGGSVALLANLRLGLPAVSYYGARNVGFIDEPLRAPMLFHFGADDASTPAADIDRQRAAWPQAIIEVHPGAGHAFNRDVDPAHYHANAATRANAQTLAFFREHLA
ncbi:dienelactone hydrolase family protein [Solilutibacter silvestris]|uniref:Dienelactone hydrolase n=1 Tax=Solilutibacter silvestris TaxID=1645665 RepID=A0A2K1PYZ9_9GAMM|nr:dienelactone hydrolase family protein [Lysobacter silvestris]PNS07999.1 Dienelactone hydrolase [Lysobacter silvestris]